MKQKQRALIEVSSKVHERLKKISKKADWKIKDVANAMITTGLDAYDAGNIVLADASAQVKGSITQDRSKK